MAQVNMPKLSDTMEEGTVLEWRKKDGEPVKKGEVLAEIESDKASFEIESEADGTLHVVVAQGQAVPVGQLIAEIGAGDGAGSAGSQPADQPTEQAAAARPEQPATEVPGDKEAAAVAEAEPGGEASAQSRPATAAGQQEAGAPGPAEPEKADGVRASPVARRLAREMGVDLSGLKGSGPEGRIVKEDVLAAATPERGKPAAAATPSPTPSEPRQAAAGRPAPGLTRMQATIARRMTESKTTVPHFYATLEVRVDDAERVRAQLKATVPAADRVTMTDFLTRACALALRRFPEVNASWSEGSIEHKDSVNIGLAVPPAEGLGLLVPVIHDADRKDLIQLSIEARQVIERARSGRPGEGDLSGGTFSISNLGMYGVEEFNAIINPPEAAILAVGAIRQAPIVENGEIVAGKVMRMTLSVDHRVFYGATAAQFLAEVKRLLENPISLVMPPET